MVAKIFFNRIQLEYHHFLAIYYSESYPKVRNILQTKISLWKLWNSQIVQKRRYFLSYIRVINVTFVQFPVKAFFFFKYTEWMRCGSTVYIQFCNMLLNVILFFQVQKLFLLFSPVPEQLITLFFKSVLSKNWNQY